MGGVTTTATEVGIATATTTAATLVGTTTPRAEVIGTGMTATAASAVVAAVAGTATIGLVVPPPSAMVAMRLRLATPQRATMASVALTTKEANEVGSLA